MTRMPGFCIAGAYSGQLRPRKWTAYYILEAVALRIVVLEREHASFGASGAVQALTDPRGARPGGRCLDGGMTTEQEEQRVVSASREIAAGPERIFELIADPARQPGWDGNDNLAHGGHRAAGPPGRRRVHDDAEPR